MNKLKYIILALGLIFSARAATEGTNDKPKDPVVIRYTFNGDESEPQAWRIYDYAGDGQAGGKNVFYPVTWESKGGVANSGYVWADDSRWRIDTPEKPNSILALLVYQQWKVPLGIGQGKADGKGGPTLDLRNAQVSVFLRGDNLDLKGAKCYFWIVSGRNRWHFYGQALDIANGKWGKRITFVLKNDESLWHRSWLDSRTNPPPTFDQSLGNVLSYGFSFVGFSAEVTGKLSMDDFEIKPAGP